MGAPPIARTARTRCTVTPTVRDSRLDRQWRSAAARAGSATTLATSIIQKDASWRVFTQMCHCLWRGAHRWPGWPWMGHRRAHAHQLVIEDGRRFSALEVATLGESLCRAVAAVHGAGLVHGDIKAQNVMLDRDDRVVLMDFGTGHERTTRPDARLAGTPLYLPPELLSGQAPASTHSDVYSIGVLLFFLLAGTYPVVAGDLEQLRAAHARGERRSLQSLRVDAPQPLRLVIEQAIAPDPSQRFPAAAALGDALRGTQTEAGGGPREWRRISRRQAAAAAVVLLTASSGVRPPERNRRRAAPFGRLWSCRSIIGSRILPRLPCQRHHRRAHDGTRKNQLLRVVAHDRGERSNALPMHSSKLVTMRLLGPS